MENMISNILIVTARPRVNIGLPSILPGGVAGPVLCVVSQSLDRLLCVAFDTFLGTVMGSRLPPLGNTRP